VLQYSIFPFGRSYTTPKDKLNSQVVELILSPSEARDRLTAGIYLPSDMEQPVNILERALIRMIEAEPLMDKIKKAMRKGELESKTVWEALEEAVKKTIINDREAKSIKEAIELQQEVIQVDDFDANEFIKEQSLWQSQEKQEQTAQSM
jgi:acyl-CoA dehydrogenase